MSSIERNPIKSVKERYDLIIIGGGIYGATLALEATRRGLRSLLLEKDDFGGKTSFNHLRILHGGLRYLQSADLRRFNESVSERSWFLKVFSEYVSVLPCLMPLYGNGVRRPSVFRTAIKINDFLSRHRNIGVKPDLKIPPGRVISAQQTKELFPAVDTDGLKGGALWYDLCMPDSYRIIIEMLRWSCAHGGGALNYFKFRNVKLHSGRVVGVNVIDTINNTEYDFSADTVINAAGPWSRSVSRRAGCDIPELFHPSLAWNILFNIPALSNSALAVAPRGPKGRTYFLVPWKGKLLAGTGHAPWNIDLIEDPVPTKAQVDEFMEHLNCAIPSLSVGPDDIEHIFSGLLPAKDEHSDQIAKKSIIINHQEHGGPAGLYSVSGVKFTTSRLVAEETLKVAFPTADAAHFNDDDIASFVNGRSDKFIFDKSDTVDIDKLFSKCKEIIAEESVIYDEDLLFRRTNLWEFDDTAIHDLIKMIRKSLLSRNNISSEKTYKNSV